MSGSLFKISLPRISAGGIGGDVMKYYRETWVVHNRPGNVSELMREFGISDCFARILWNRGFTTTEQVAAYLRGGDGAIEWPVLPGEEAFLACLGEALEEGGRFRVIGDYDVDGVTATYLCVSALRLLGAEADYRIPDRVSDGYGVSEELVRRAAGDGVRTLITVDNGIAAVRQIALARELGMRVLVTDHHEPQRELPPADAIVDPKLAPEGERIENLCGAAVAAILADRMLEATGRPGFARSRMEILALATVCDVMPLTGIARSIVRQGLAKPREQWNPGLRALAEANQLETVNRCYHFGFVLGPCINALGRLETADYGVELLLTSDPGEMREAASRMVDVNTTRKAQTKEYTEQAIAVAAKMLRENPDRSVLVVELPNCHESLAGIVAGKVRERFGRPAFVLVQPDGRPDERKGSGRSTESFSMFGAMMECSSLFTKFGGHAMAAGLTIPKSAVPAFCEAMERSFRSQGATTVARITIDLVMPFRYVTEELVGELSGMEPFGNGNSKPVFAQKNVSILSLRPIGRDGQYLSLKLRDSEGTEMSAVYFGDSREFLDGLEGRFGAEARRRAEEGHGDCSVDLCFYPDINRYNGRSYLQVQISAYHWPEKGGRG